MDHAQHLAGAMAASGGALPALMLALFLGGLSGGFTHCAGMCGPFVAAQVAAGHAPGDDARMTEWVRLKGALLVPYHLGRFTTYVALGALSGFAAAALRDTAIFRYLAAALLALAAAAFLVQALGRGAAFLPGLPGAGIGAKFSAALSALAAPLMSGAHRPSARYALGVVLGFLPCGLLYGALAAAAATGGAAGGALVMASFTLGTVPALVGVGMIGDFLLRRARAAAAIFAGLLLINAAILSWLALRALAQIP